MTSISNRRTTLRGAVSLFLFGMIGVVALATYTVPTLRAVPGLDTLPYPALLAVAGVNSTLFLVIFVVLGTLTAPRVGFRSHVFDWATGTQPRWDVLRSSLPSAIGLGAGLFVVAALLEAALDPFVAATSGAVLSDGDSLRALATSLPMRLFYGGITEELLLRWGLMAPVVWIIHRIRVRGSEAERRPAATTVWAAIIVSAILFGVGHLPAAVATTALTVPLAAKVVLLNTVVGVGFGWLFWRHSLETAMAAHMAFHVALVAVSAILIVLT